jgi:DoxX-like family
MNPTNKIHRACTGVICAVMTFSVINFNLAHPVGPSEGSFAHLALPDYFRIELSTAKVLGIVALLLPGVPLKLKEFAYFGFGITLVSASVAHFSQGDGPMFVIDPLIFLGILITSYRYLHRKDNRPHIQPTKLT